MKELALEPETVEVLDEIRRPVPGRMPGAQIAAARCVSVKPVVGAYLSGLGLRMVPFCTHINCAPGMAALFARFEGEALADRLVAFMQRWLDVGLDTTVLQGMLRAYYAEVRRKLGAFVPLQSAA